MAKKKYTLEQLSTRTKPLTSRQMVATKGGYKNIPTSGAGSYGLVTWETVDIRRPNQTLRIKPLGASALTRRFGG